MKKKPLRHVVLHLTSSNLAKQWPMPHAEALADWLLANADRHVHCLGAASDRAVYETLKAKLPVDQAARLHIHCGSMDLLESMAFLNRMDLVVGVDSGTLHMAAAAGVPVIALFGPMDSRKWVPPGAEVVLNPLPCQPCNLAFRCPYDFECMKGLRTEAVIERIKAYAGFS